MRVFVSHISEEAGVAAILKDWIESTFLGQVSVFVSSDPADIPAGGGPIDEPELARILSSKTTALSYDIRPLVATHLVRQHLRLGGPIAYSIADDGVALLVRKGLLK